MKEQNSKRKYRGYNPFKMWGSAVGSLIYLLVFGSVIFNIISIFKILIYPIEFVSNFFQCNAVSAYGITCFAVIIIITLVIGALIGWGIESLVKYIANRRTK